VRQLFASRLDDFAAGALAFTAAPEFRPACAQTAFDASPFVGSMTICCEIALATNSAAASTSRRRAMFIFRFCECFGMSG
jgi:hypothetical protein